MIKKFFSLFIAIFIFVINCLPVYAAEFVSGNFKTVPDNFIPDINLTIQEGHKYIYYFQSRNNSWEGPDHHIIYFDFPLEVEGLISESRIVLTNSDNSDSVVYWTRSLGAMDGQFYSGKTMAVGESFSIGLGLVVVPELLVYNGDCVSKNYCSSDVFVEIGSDDDYNEEGVVIKGLTGFFNKVTSTLDSLVDNLILKLQEMIGLPLPEGYFSTKFEEIKNTFSDRYNLDFYYNVFESLKNIQPTKPVFDETLSFKLFGVDFSIPFKIDFSAIDGIRDYLFVFIRAFGYFYLIIYNMNQYYLLFRGQRFFYDMRDSYSYTDSNGKQHSHERGEKKWY